MKKFFASLLALVGMVAGLTLTSCGGGGGGGNLSGTTIMANGASSAYQISIGKKVEGSEIAPGLGAYECTISDVEGSMTSNMVMTITKLEYGEDDETIKRLEAAVAPASFVADDNAAFYNIITGIISTNKAITKLTFPEGSMQMIFTPTQITWKGMVSYSAIADNSKLKEEITVNLMSPVVAISKGSY